MDVMWARLSTQTDSATKQRNLSVICTSWHLHPPHATANIDMCTTSAITERAASLNSFNREQRRAKESNDMMVSTPVFARAIMASRTSASMVPFVKLENLPKRATTCKGPRNFLARTSWTAVARLAPMRGSCNTPAEVTRHSIAASAWFCSSLSDGHSRTLSPVPLESKGDGLKRRPVSSERFSRMTETSLLDVPRSNDLKKLAKTCNDRSHITLSCRDINTDAVSLAPFTFPEQNS
mmetsp:Transcript_3971/g.12370  ORF Transcript_3971/g.12370 Transcript_3971/m.12370 type:complete len:237 (-) Transcript_3971:1436-2146(-)